MGELKERAAVLLGAALLAGIGKQRFYEKAQTRDGISGRIASAFCQGHAGRVGQNFEIFRQNKDRDRMTTVAQQYYSDDDLHGFATDSRMPNVAIADQPRGRLIPLIETALAESGARSVLEIGVGNGDLVAEIARRHPAVTFTGVDLSTVSAAKRHALPNLTFHQGYPLDVIRQGLRGELVFASSTFCIFSPRELVAYLTALKGARRLLLLDPVLPGFERYRYGSGQISRHMDLYMWWHDYPGYLADAGWRITSLDFIEYQYPTKLAKMVMLSAERTAWPS